MSPIKILRSSGVVLKLGLRWRSSVNAPFSEIKLSIKLSLATDAYASWETITMQLVRYFVKRSRTHLWATHCQPLQHWYFLDQLWPTHKETSRGSQLGVIGRQTPIRNIAFQNYLLWQKGVIVYRGLLPSHVCSLIVRQPIRIRHGKNNLIASTTQWFALACLLRGDLSWEQKQCPTVGRAIGDHLDRLYLVICLWTINFYI